MMILNWTPKRNVGCGMPYASKRFWNAVEGENKVDSGVNWRPVTDIFDNENEYVLRMEVPGLEKSDLNIEVKRESLTVSGERKIEFAGDVENTQYRLSERRGKKFHRQFRLPKNVDGKKVVATLKNGVLEIKVPKPEEVKPKSIAIH